MHVLIWTAFLPFVSHNQEPVIVFRTEDSFEVEKYLTDKGFHVYTSMKEFM